MERTREEAKAKLRALLYAPDIDEVRRRVGEAWILGERFPVPKFTPTCPGCCSDRVIFRRMRFFKVGGPATTPYRCDVYAKCSSCSLVFTYGLVIPEAMWKANEKFGQIHRKTILAELEEMDGF